MRRRRLILTLTMLITAVCARDFDQKFKSNIERALDGGPQQFSTGPDGRKARVGFSEDPDILLERKENKESFEKAGRYATAFKCAVVALVVQALMLVSTFLIRKRVEQQAGGSDGRFDSSLDLSVGAGGGEPAVPGS